MTRGVSVAVLMILGLVASDALLHQGQTETSQKRGAYLVQGIANCGNCHSPQAADGTVTGPPLSGGPALLSANFTAYPPNLTSDVATGIGGWSEDQIVTALRDGRTPSGAVLRLPMPVPLYRGMSDRDAHAIAVYLKSLPPVENKVPESIYRAPTPASYGPLVGHVADPDIADPVATGAYLVRIGHCMQCHTPLGEDGRRDYAHRLGAGGLVMDGVFGARVTPNITPDATDGIGGWSDRDIGVALTTGVTPTGVQLASPMPWRYLAHVTQPDVGAIVAYLRTIPPVPTLLGAEH